MNMGRKQYCLHLIIVFAVLLFVSSCTYIDKIKLRAMIKHEYGRVLDFSWPGFQILEDTVLADFVINKPITIISHINKELCEECFANYLRVAEQYVNHFHSDSIQFVCVAYPRPVEKLQYALSMAKIDSSKVMIVYDSQNLYLKKNSIARLESGYNAFLIDKDHKIVLLGDPIRVESMSKLCKTTILSMLDDLKR